MGYKSHIRWIFILSLLFSFMLLSCSRVSNPLENASLLNNAKDVTVQFTVTGGPLSVDESGGTDSFTIVLNSAPASGVKICLLNGDPTESIIALVGDVLGPDPDCRENRLEFTSIDWNIPKTVPVAGLDDGFSDGDKIFKIYIPESISSDSGFNGTTTLKVDGTTADNEGPAGFNVIPVAGFVTWEGGSNNFTVQLNSPPEYPVKVCLSSSLPAEADIAIGGDVLGPDTDCPVARLEFNQTNWFMPQNVNVAGKCDAVPDGNVPYNVILTSSGLDPVYSLIDPADVSGTNNDVASSVSCSYNYTPPAAGVFTTISGTGIPIWGVTADDQSSPIIIPFTFFFNGIGYTTVHAGTNGHLAFVASSSLSNQNLFNNFAPQNVLAPWWDDLIVSSTNIPASEMYYEITGITPNQIFTVEWNNVYRFGSTDTYFTFQAKLYETSNVIEFIYDTAVLGTTTVNASIGIKGDATVIGTDFIEGLTGSIGAGNENLTVADFPPSGTVITFFP